MERLIYWSFKIRYIGFMSGFGEGLDTLCFGPLRYGSGHVFSCVQPTLMADCPLAVKGEPVFPIDPLR